MLQRNFWWIGKKQLSGELIFDDSVKRLWTIRKANQADLSMCVLKSCGMSAVCTWGLRGIFFSYSYFLCSSPTVLCAALWQSSFLHMYRTISNTPYFMLKYELCAYFWPSAITPPGGLAGNVVFSDVVRSWFWRHVFVSSRHDGPTQPTCRRHHVMSGSFFLCRMSCRYLIADMSWIA